MITGDWTLKNLDVELKNYLYPGGPFFASDFIRTMRTKFPEEMNALDLYSVQMSAERCKINYITTDVMYYLDGIRRERNAIIGVKTFSEYLQRNIGANTSFAQDCKLDDGSFDVRGRICFSRIDAIKNLFRNLKHIRFEINSEFAELDKAKFSRLLSGLVLSTNVVYQETHGIDLHHMHELLSVVFTEQATQRDLDDFVNCWDKVDRAVEDIYNFVLSYEEAMKA